MFSAKCVKFVNAAVIFLCFYFTRIMEQSGLEFNVNFYEQHPCGFEQLHTQVEIALDRLALYNLFQAQECLTAEELKSQLSSNLKYLLEANYSVKEVMTARRMDFIGHWTLRIAYSNAHPSFFIKNEIRWFKLRFNNMPHNDRLQFINKNKIMLIEATEEEKTKFSLKNGTWYKIAFAEVTSLFRKRLYPLHAGYLFVPQHKIGYLLLERLERHLKNSLEHIKKMLPNSCDQLKSILSSITLVQPKTYFSKRALQLQDLEDSVKHFPLCMKIQHETLWKNHHLKHPSRFQYGLFLKGIGLSLQDSLKMWQEEFTKIMPEKRFLKQYSYYFKHLYGVVGNKSNYPPLSCDKILENGPGFSGGVSGCPYKHWGAEVLTERLEEEGVSDSSIRRIIDLKKEEKYKTACTQCFGNLRGCKVQEITHPNMYYEQSCSTEIEDLFKSDSE